MISLERIIDEYKEFKDKSISNCGITVGLENKNDYRLWKATMIGPNETSYKGGTFLIKIKFPDEYPLKAPIAYFYTPIYHINVNPKAPKSPGDLPLGNISISTLSQWKPENSIKELLINIFVLLTKPNPYNPYGLDRAEEFIINRTKYEEKARKFTRIYANIFKCQKNYDRNIDWNFNL